MWGEAYSSGSHSPLLSGHSSRLLNWIFTSKERILKQSFCFTASKMAAPAFRWVFFNNLVQGPPCWSAIDPVWGCAQWDHENIFHTKAGWQLHSTPTPLQVLLDMGPLTAAEDQFYTPAACVSLFKDGLRKNHPIILKEKHTQWTHAPQQNKTKWVCLSCRTGSALWQGLALRLKMSLSLPRRLS